MNEFVLAQMDIALIYAFRFKSINEADKVDVKRTNRKRKNIICIKVDVQLNYF